MKDWARFNPTHSYIQETDQGLFRVKFGVPTANEAEALEEAKWLQHGFNQIKASRPDKPIAVLVDMTSIDDSEYIPGDVWKIYLEIVKDPFLEKTAVVGGTEAMRSIINFYFKYWAREAVKFFQADAEAVAWLLAKI
jgi:hypothetical protein